MKVTSLKPGMEREEGRGGERLADSLSTAPALADRPQIALQTRPPGIALRTGSQQSKGSAPSLLAAPPSGQGGPAASTERSAGPSWEPSCLDWTPGQPRKAGWWPTRPSCSMARHSRTPSGSQPHPTRSAHVSAAGALPALDPSRHAHLVPWGTTELPPQPLWWAVPGTHHHHGGQSHLPGGRGGGGIQSLSIS